MPSRTDVELVEGWLDTVRTSDSQWSWNKAAVQHNSRIFNTEHLVFAIKAVCRANLTLTTNVRPLLSGDETELNNILLELLELLAFSLLSSISSGTVRARTPLERNIWRGGGDPCLTVYYTLAVHQRFAEQSADGEMLRVARFDDFCCTLSNYIITALLRERTERTTIPHYMLWSKNYPDMRSYIGMRDLNST